MEKYAKFYPELEKYAIGKTIIRPKVLIEYKRKEFVVSRVALEELKQVQLPIGVIGVAGPERLGKSFLMNLLLKEKQGFVTGEHEPLARGVWMWVKEATARGGEKVALVLLDTEGINKDFDEEFDNKIQTLIVLLSDIFVYNTFSTIDQGSLKRLNFVSKMSQYIQFKGEDGEEKVVPKHLSPLFIWLLRDVFLKPTIPGTSTELADDEYMDYELATLAEQKKYLKESEGEVDDDEEENTDPQKLGLTAEIDLIKSKFRSFFPFRSCFRLVRPITEEDKLRNVEQNMDDVRPEFIVKMKEVIEYIYQNISVKKFKDGSGSEIDCNGEVFSKFVKQCVSRINGGEGAYIDLDPNRSKERVVLKQQMKFMKNMMTMLEKQMKFVGEMLGEDV